MSGEPMVLKMIHEVRARHAAEMQGLGLDEQVEKISQEAMPLIQRYLEHRKRCEDLRSSKAA